MRPQLTVFQNENLENSYVTFKDKMKPRITWDDEWDEEFGTWTDKEGAILKARTAEMLLLVDQAIFEHYMDENNEQSLCGYGDDFPNRTVLTGNYYIGCIGYNRHLTDEKGHLYDKKDGRYRDLYSRDQSGRYTHFLDTAQHLRLTYQVIIEARLTSMEKGAEVDYAGIDFSLELDKADGEIAVEILSHDVI